MNQRTHKGKTYVKVGPTGHYVRPRHVGKVDITKLVDGEEMLYLRRWYLFRCRWFSVRLHHIVLPDVDRWPHDHPWPFVAIVLQVNASKPADLLYYVVAGLLWVLPAGLLVRWMQRPDPAPPADAGDR